MRKSKLLALRQLDQRIKPFFPAFSVKTPFNGWINNIRSTLKMTQQQLGERLNISKQSVSKIEARETEGSISLKSLQEVGQAMDLKLVYGFIPMEGSFEDLVDKKAQCLAKKIVLRTHQNMKMEDQAVNQKRLDESVKEPAQEIKAEMRKTLWD